MARTRGVAAVLVAAGLAACGGGGGGGVTLTDVDCAWLAGDNCWKRSVAAAHACVDAGATGTFADGATSRCDYPDGVRLDFATPAFDSAGGAPWSFTVKAAGGATCATYQEGSRTRTLTTGLGTYSEVVTGDTLATLTTTFTCPDGNAYRIGREVLVTCDFLQLPDADSTDVDGVISFSLLPAPAADPAFWTCRPPP